MKCKAVERSANVRFMNVCPVFGTVCHAGVVGHEANGSNLP